MLWVRPMGSLAAELLLGTEGAADPFWSPDSQFLGFFAQGKLKKIAISGGAPRTLCDAPDPRGGSWSRDGVIVFTPHPSAGVHRVSAAGGSVAAVTMLDKARQESSHRWPSFLPDGRHFLYLVFGTKREEIGVFLASLETGEMKRLVTAESNALYAPPGFLLFAREGALMAQSFDAAERQLTGEPFSLADRVRVSLLRRASLSASENAVLVYDSSGGSQDCRLGWFNRQGKRLGVIGSTGLYQSVRLSPDEKRLAVVQLDRQTGTGDIWLLDLSRGTDSRFTFDPAGDGAPIWSPDGSRVAWNSNRDGLANLYQKVTSGAGQDELLLKSDIWKHPLDWSGDRRFILYGKNDPKTKSDLWILPLEGNREPFPFAQTQFREMQGRFSHDSKWIAYVSDESGSGEVYVQAFPASGGKFRISSRGGNQPIWRGDGEELFYISADQKMMAVEVKSGTGAKEGFEIGVPKALFNVPVTGIDVNYDVTDDGRRFLVVTNEETTAAPITVVLNWTAELKR
jgi:Tol biopolymer transport system component